MWKENNVFGVYMPFKTETSNDRHKPIRYFGKQSGIDITVWFQIWSPAFFYSTFPTMVYSWCRIMKHVFGLQVFKALIENNSNWLWYCYFDLSDFFRRSLILLSTARQVRKYIFYFIEQPPLALKLLALWLASWWQLLFWLPLVSSSSTNMFTKRESGHGRHNRWLWHILLPNLSKWPCTLLLQGLSKVTHHPPTIKGRQLLTPHEVSWLKLLVISLSRSNRGSQSLDWG